MHKKNRKKNVKKSLCEYMFTILPSVPIFENLGICWWYHKQVILFFCFFKIYYVLNDFIVKDRNHFIKAYIYTVSIVKCQNSI